MDTIKLLEVIDAKIVKLQKREFKGMSLEDFAKDSLLLSGQQRSVLFEDYLVQNGFDAKIPAGKDRGDLIRNGLYYELKTRVLSKKDIEKGKLHSAGQIRLWQNVDFYLFITVEKETGKVYQYKVPKSDLINHIEEGRVPFSSSHITGQSKDKWERMFEIELGVVLDSRKVDWNQYLI